MFGLLRTSPGQTFAFAYDNAFQGHNREVMCNPLRRAVPLLQPLLRVRIQHAACLSSCGLLDRPSRLCPCSVLSALTVMTIPDETDRNPLPLSIGFETHLPFTLAYCVFA